MVYIECANLNSQGSDGLQGSPGPEGPQGLEVSVHFIFVMRRTSF